MTICITIVHTILTTISCSRLKMNIREEKMFSEIEVMEEEIDTIEVEIRSKEVEDIDLEMRTSTGYTLFHLLFMSKVEDGYALLKKMLSSSKLKREVESTKKAKMMEDERRATVVDLLNREDECGRTPLKLGVEEHSIEIVRACVEDEELRELIDWNKKDSRGVSPIVEATLRDDIEMCELLERVAKRSYKKRIVRSVEEGKRVVLEELLKRVDVNRYEGARLVDIAVEREDIDMLHLLLKYGAKVSRRLQNIGMMLFKEIDRDIYEELLEMTEIKSEMLSILMKKIDEEERGRTSLMYAIEGHCSLEILKKIVTRMSIEEVLKEDLDGRTIREYRGKNKKYIKELYDTYARAKEGRELIALSYGGNLELVEKLIESGVDIEVSDRYGSRALTSAAFSGHMEIVDRLIEAGANIEAADRSGNRILMWAVAGNNMDIVSKLVEQGADIDAVNKEGDTALMSAADDEKIEVVKKLIELGANIDAADRYGNTALMWAVINEHVEMLPRLVELGADIDAVDRYGNTALMIAVQNRHAEIVSTLMRLGADVNIANEDGETALSLALKRAIEK